MKQVKCRLCSAPLGEPVLKLPATPLANEYLECPEPQDLFPLEISCCIVCGHYQLNEQVEPERMFRHYLFVAGTSPVNVEHFRKYAAHIVEYCGLKPGAKVLDIASNDGTLLRHFKDLGMEVLGIDPAKNIAEEATARGIPTLPDFFTEEKADEILKDHGRFDVITANNVFAHVPDMIGFTKGVKKLLAPDGLYTFEVSYFGDVIDKTLFDTIYHEHTSYHTVEPLIQFFHSHGLRLFHTEHVATHGGSIRMHVCHRIALVPDLDLWASRFHLQSIIEKEKNIPSKIAELQHNIKDLSDKLLQQLKRLKDEGKSIAIYGTPAKATTLSYALDLDPAMFDFAVDDAPLKQGRFTPGKHIPILHPDSIYEHQPDVLLVLAWNFAPSIIEKVRKKWFEQLGNYRYPTFITPLPELTITRYCEDAPCTCGQGPWEYCSDKNYSFGPLKHEAYKCQDCGGIDFKIICTCGKWGYCPGCKEE